MTPQQLEKLKGLHASGDGIRNNEAAFQGTQVCEREALPTHAARTIAFRRNSEQMLIQACGGGRILDDEDAMRQSQLPSRLRIPSGNAEQFGKEKQNVQRV